MMKIPLYNLWMDNMFYVYAALFAAALALGVYSVRRWLDLRAGLAAAGEEGPAAPAEAAEHPVLAEGERPEQEDMVVPDEPGEGPAAAPEDATPPGNQDAREVEELISLAAEEAAGKTLPPMTPESAEHRAACGATAARIEREPAAPPEAAAEQPSQAGDFVKGIYRSMAGIDARVGAIEESLAKGPGGNHFPVKFLEGLLEDLDSMEKDKVKARIEYLLTDLKAERGGEGKN